MTKPINYTTIPREDGKNCGNCIETQRDDFGGACYYAGEIGNHYCDMWASGTISKTKLLEWVRQQQKNATCKMGWGNYGNNIILKANLSCWNLLTEAIEEGEFDE